jgi:hypothetical protein
MWHVDFLFPDHFSWFQTIPSNFSANSNKPVPPRKIGILLVNLGTPDAPRFWPVRRFLKEFLSDPRGLRPTVKTVVTGVEMFRKLLDQGQAGDKAPADTGHVTAL